MRSTRGNPKTRKLQEIAINCPSNVLLQNHQIGKRDVVNTTKRDVPNAGNQKRSTHSPQQNQRGDKHSIERNIAALKGVRPAAK